MKNFFAEILKCIFKSIWRLIATIVIILLVAIIIIILFDSTENLIRFIESLQQYAE